MKKHIFLTVATVVTLFSATTNAQTLVPPTLPDNYWYTANSSFGAAFTYIAGLNTAMIDFSTVQCPLTPRPYGSLIVSDYYGNNTRGGISFLDACSGFVVNINYPLTPLGNWMTNSPDIIVGNSLADPDKNYIVAAAFINNVGTRQIDYWRVTYVSPVSFTVTYMSTTTLTAPIPGIGTIHLDIIAEASNTLATGLPWCDKFVVTYDDVATGNVYAAQASLNAPPAVITLGASTLINTPLTPGGAPDVAAIQRKVGGPIHDMALIAWTDGTNMYYNEWDITATTVGIPTTLESVLSPLAMKMPRIDAPDDHNINTPPGTVFPAPGFSYYKIAAEVSSMSWTWDNYMPTATPSWDNASFVTLGSPHHSPTVAYGPNNGTQYAVSHYTNGGVWPVNNHVVMEPIDWTNPYSLALSPMGALDYFKVNLTPANSALWNFQNAISTPCNNPADRTLVTWAVYNGLTTNYDVYYKLTDYNGVSPNGYAFKNAAESTFRILDWSLHPNPATSSLTITVPVTEAQYRITDLLGRVLQAGRLNIGVQQVDISGLAPATYIVASGNDFRSVFIKQ